MAETAKIIKTQYDGYCIGVGVEYPGIVVWGNTEEEMVGRFQSAIPSYIRALKYFGVSEKSNVEILTAVDCSTL